MKIGKEGWIVIAAVGFLVAWIIDRLAGPVHITVDNPISFLQSPILLQKYPFTLTAIIIRSAAIFISVMVVISFVGKKYFTKALVLLLALVFGEFYAIQQLATGFQLTSVQWTLSIAYGCVFLVLGVLSMILMGVWSTFNNKAPSEPLNNESH